MIVYNTMTTSGWIKNRKRKACGDPYETVLVHIRNMHAQQFTPASMATMFELLQVRRRDDMTGSLMQRNVAEQSRAEQSRAEQSRAEQSRAEQSRAEQSRAEQSRAEQSRAEQSRAEQSRAEQSRAEQAHASLPSTCQSQLLYQFRAGRRGW